MVIGSTWNLPLSIGVTEKDLGETVGDITEKNLGVTVGNDFDEDKLNVSVAGVVSLFSFLNNILSFSAILVLKLSESSEFLIRFSSDLGMVNLFWTDGE